MLGAAALVALAGCASTPAPLAASEQAARGAAASEGAAGELVLRVEGDRNLFLLGEVHDNPAHHAIRLRAFERLLASGVRPALLMEQLDRDRQPDIDRLRAARPAAGAAALVDAAGGMPGWDRRAYEPFIALALAHDLPVVAANVSRADARRVIADGLASAGFDAGVPADVAAAHAAEIVDSHCGLVDRPTAERMARAQAARDQEMARLIARHADRGAVLLAGIGHVRKAVGVGRWLPAELRRRTVSVGLTEAGDDGDVGRFDRVVVTAAHERADPCAAAAPAAPATPASPTSPAAPTSSAAPATPATLTTPAAPTSKASQ